MSRPVVGGWQTIPGTIAPFGALEHQLLDLRTRMKESNEIHAHDSQKAVLLNFGDIETEMKSERTRTVITPSGTSYSMDVGTPLFLKRSRADVHRFAGLVGDNAGATTITLAQPASVFNLVPGLKVTINGEDRTITAAAGSTITLNGALTTAPQAGAQIITWGRDIHNPHLAPIYKITDKYGSHILDQDRYQVDYSTGLVRYRPNAGGFNAASIWHPENAADKPYYFGRQLTLSQLPPPDILGQDNDPGFASDSVLPNNFTNLRITAANGVFIQVELNGGIIASTSNASGGLLVPFYDNNPDNDNLKEDEAVDPDNYIYKYLRVGTNQLVIKATRPNSVAAGNAGVRVQGFDGQGNTVTPLFAGVDISTTDSEISPDPLDWSTSQHSVLGVAGKISFQLTDRNELEDIVDRTEQNNSVLESLTSMLADLDINHLKGLLAVIR